MTMDMKAMWVLIIATLFFGIGSYQGFVEWRAAMAVSEVVDAKVIKRRSIRSGILGRSSYDFYLDYSVPSLGPHKVGRTEVSRNQWNDTEGGDLFKLHYVADDPDRSMANPQRNRDFNILWGFLSAASLALAATMACVVVVLKSPMKRNA